MVDNRGKNNPNFNNKWSKRQKENHSILMKRIMNKPKLKKYMKNHRPDISGKNNPMFGIHRFGKDCPGFKHGESLKKHYCIDCKKEISWETAINGGKRCKKCSNIAKRIFIPDSFCLDCGKKIGNRNKRCRSCARKNYLRTHPFPMGKNAINYIHGQGYNPYPMEFNDQLKESIRKRDTYECQNCGMTEEEHLIVIGRILDVHHIDYNKQNCQEHNLISLCQQCNIRANFNRDYWYAYYIYLMEKILCPKFA